MAEKVKVALGLRERSVPAHVAAEMVAQYGWAYVTPKAELPKEEISSVKQALREAEDVEWIEAQIRKEKDGFNRSSIIKTAEKRISELTTQE